MGEQDKDSCACTQRLMDVLRAAKPKKGLLKRVTCAKCGKVFWTNGNDNLCFECGEN